jgi:hypothetical protein
MNRETIALHLIEQQLVWELRNRAISHLRSDTRTFKRRRT